MKVADISFQCGSWKMYVRQSLLDQTFLKYVQEVYNSV